MEKAATFIAALAAALASSAASAPAPRFPPYDCASFVPEVRGKATGFFRVAKRPDGRWWAIDPLGRGIVLMGVDHVRYRGIKCQRTGRSPYLETNMRRYPDRRDWEAFALGNLKKWGFNLLGAGCDPSLEHRGLAHTVSLRIGLSMCGGASDASLWICPYENHPSRAFPNVFDPRFAEICDAAGSRLCTMFYYYISGDGTPHPDVRFDLPGDPPPGSPEEAWRLMPGETFDPKGAMWAVFAGGEGGISGWEAAASALEKEACALP